MRLDARAAVVADVVVVDDGVLLNHGAVFVDVGHMHAAEVRDRAVIRKGSATPLAAEEADAAVAEAVVHSAVEANVGAPVAAMPSVETTCESPITGSPEYADPRRINPDAGNPVIAGVAVGPVAGSPYVTRSGQRWLHIHRQCWRCDANRNEDAGVCPRCRQREHGSDDGDGKEQSAKF